MLLFCGVLFGILTGVKGLTIGSNGANYPPQVPKLHLWKDEQSGTEVVVVYHPYGYGGYSASTCDGPGKCGDCAEAPNGVALCTEFRTDNTGPPSSTDEIIASLDAVRAEYPKASVFASTFDNFIRDVLPVKDQLPVITKEVGDTWMYGAASDPLKMVRLLCVVVCCCVLLCVVVCCCVLLCIVVCIVVVVVLLVCCCCVVVVVCC